MKGLSELSCTYINYIEDIHAGERALADDVGRVLAEVARGRTDGTAVTATSLEQRRDLEGVVFTHRMTWEPREGWPLARFEAKGDTGLFDRSFLREDQLVQPDRDALLAWLDAHAVFWIVFPPEDGLATPAKRVARTSPRSWERLAQVAIPHRLIPMSWVEQP